MRGRGVLGLLLAVCGAVVLSAPARADQYDFILQLDDAGVSYASVSDMIDIGKAVCHDLRSDIGPPVVLGKLRGAGFAPAEAAIILMSAVDTMCVDAKPGVAAWAQTLGSPAAI